MIDVGSIVGQKTVTNRATFHMIDLFFCVVGKNHNGGGTSQFRGLRRRLGGQKCGFCDRIFIRDILVHHDHVLMMMVMMMIYLMREALWLEVNLVVYDSQVGDGQSMVAVDLFIVKTVAASFG